MTDKTRIGNVCGKTCEMEVPVSAISADGVFHGTVDTISSGSPSLRGRKWITIMSRAGDGSVVSH
jgi:hypothetical protein